MLIAVIVLQVLILLVLCVIARRLPKQSNVVNNFTVGDVASKEYLREFVPIVTLRTAPKPGPAEPEPA
jgi:hypothetical protein